MLMCRVSAKTVQCFGHPSLLFEIIPAIDYSSVQATCIRSIKNRSVGIVVEDIAFGMGGIGFNLRTG